MIYIANTSIDYINIGSNMPSIIDVGSTQVWPSGYYYTLTFKSVSYSSSTQVRANGNNYATFTCYYRKYLIVNDSLVSTEEVVATPSASYFVESSNHLYFDYDEYKGTQVISGTKTATLTYNGLSTTGDFTFQGNYSSYSSSITPIVPDSSTVPCTGGTISYTGGVVTTNKTWTSGYVETTTQKANFTYPASNSQATSVVGYIVSYYNEIHIPSLERNMTSGQSSYTFTSDSYNGQTVSITIYQAQNARYQTSMYAFWDVRTNAPYGTTLTLPAAYTTGDDTFGTIVFCIKYTTITYYDADPTQVSSGGTTVMNSDYDVTAYAVQGGGCITSVNRAGSENWTGSYSPNTTQNMKETILVAVESSSYSQWNASQQVQQPHQ